MRNKKMEIRIAGIGIILLLSILACGVQLTNPTAPPVNVTQTFEALGTEMAGAPAVQTAPTVEVLAPTATTEGCPQVAHTNTPPEIIPTNRESGMHDRDDTAYASLRRSNSGESFVSNLFERPFTSNVMDYIPDIDIIDAQLARSGDWVFVTIQMAGQNTAGGMKGMYGIEVDNNIDGRGDYIIYGVNPASTTWTTLRVKAYQDTNKDVGGGTPITSDTSPGNGYDTLVFDQGCINDADAAWIRLSPASSSTVQLAFKWTLIKNNSKYLWGAWASVPEMFNPAWFDYNDHFTHAIAGSPMIELVDYYPLKQFWGWDNTCRWIVGKVLPEGTEPGLCPYTPPEEAKKQPNQCPIGAVCR